MRRLLACLLTICSACDSAADRAQSAGARTDSIFLDPAQVIGLGEGDSDHLFGAITSVAADAEGRIYVGDRIGVTVRAFDADGRLLYVVVLRAPLARDPPPWFGAGSIAGIIRDPDTGVERVARFDIP